MHKEDFSESKRSIASNASKAISISSRELKNIRIEHSNVPKDRFNLLYIAFLYQGMALLFPYNAFIFLLDFYQDKFCDLHLFYWAMVSIMVCSNAFFCLITNLISEYISFAKRILTGHILYIISLLFFLIFSVLATEGVLDSLPTSIGYTPLLAGLITGIGIGIAQPSYYSASSHLPKHYTQALVVGETVSGLTSAFFRISTKLLKPKNSCIFYDSQIYVGLTICVMLASFFVWPFIYYHKFSKYWLGLAKENNFLVEYRHIEQNNDEVSEESVIAGRLGSIKADQHPLLNTFKTNGSLCKRFTRSLKRKFSIFRKTCSLQFTLFFNFIITLFLFPTFTTAAYPCHPQICDWVPIISLTTFVLSDFIIRWFTLIPIKCSSFALLIISLFRLIFIPLIVLFIFPLSRPLVPVEYGLPIYLVIISAFGLTNGYFGSIPLVLIPTKLKVGEKEIGSSIGIFMLVSALVIGTFLALPFNETVLYRNFTSVCCIARNTTRPTSITPYLNITAQGGCSAIC